MLEEGGGALGFVRPSEVMAPLSKVRVDRGAPLATPPKPSLADLAGAS